MNPVIGIVVEGDPTSPATWSGAIVGLAGGLRQAGADPVPLRADVPIVRRATGRIGRSFAASASSPLQSRMRSAAAAVALRRRGRLDGVVQVGSGYVLPRGVRYVTWDDMTVAQAVGIDETTYAELDESARRRWKARQQRIYDGAVACCACSTWAARSIADDYGVAAERVPVVGFGSDHVRRAVERSWAEPRFVFVGREWERKNGPAVLRAFDRLARERPDARLDVVGGHPPIAQPGVTGHGILSLSDPEAQRRLVGLLDAATCMVMPTRYEPFGFAYLNAAAAGIPSIGTTIGGTAESVGPGGILVDPLDDDQLLDAMRRMCDPATARSLGAAGLEHSRLFTWRLVAERILRALEPAGVDVRRLAPFLQPAPAPPPRA